MGCSPAGINTCTGCGSNPCQCGQMVRSSPSPYYNQAGCIQETHCQSIVQQLFVAAVSTGADFVMPDCNATVTIPFPGLVSIQIGSYLWNYEVGYLLVTGFDAIASLVTLKNECLIGNAAPGKVIARCTLFNSVTPPCTCSAATLADFGDWLVVAETWTYLTPTSVTVPTGAASRFQTGDKIKLTILGVTNYYYVFAVPTTTSLILIGDSSAPLTNNPISDVYISRVERPFGFPDIFNYTPVLAGVGITYTTASASGQLTLKGRKCSVLIHSTGVISAPAYAINFTLPYASSSPTNSAQGMGYFWRPTIDSMMTRVSQGSGLAPDSGKSCMVTYNGAAFGAIGSNVTLSAEAEFYI